MKRRQGRMAESEFRGIQIQANRHFTRRPSVEVFKDCMRNSQPCLFFVILKAYKGIHLIDWRQESMGEFFHIPNAILIESFHRIFVVPKVFEVIWNLFFVGINEAFNENRASVLRSNLILFRNEVIRIGAAPFE
jgi:hypothetical protein